jgi:hypothetical protein
VISRIRVRVTDNDSIQAFGLRGCERSGHGSTKFGVSKRVNVRSAGGGEGFCKGATFWYRAKVCSCGGGRGQQCLQDS